MEGLVQRWRGHGWSRLSHGIHTGGGRARITVTLVSVGGRTTLLGRLSLEGPVPYSAL